MYVDREAPPLYELTAARGQLMQAYVDGCTDRELRDFVGVLQNGTERDQRAAVDGACEKGLRPMRHENATTNMTR